MKRLIAMMMFVAFAAALIGCETMKGAGRDIEDTGHNIQKTAS
jgi:predicted small secreted protein